MSKYLSRKKGDSAAITVPKNSKKNSAGNYRGMTAKPQYQEAILGNCGNGVLSNNDEQTLVKGGCIGWLLWFFVFANPDSWRVVMPLCLTLPSNHELTPIVEESGAQPQDEKVNGNKVYTGFKVKKTEPIDGIDTEESMTVNGVPYADVIPHLRILAQATGLSGTSQTEPENMFINEVNRSHNESMMSRREAKGKKLRAIIPDLHPSTTNAERPHYRQSCPVGPKFWTWQAYTVFIKDFKEDIMPYFYKDGRRLTDVLKGKGCYNLEYIESFEKQATKDLVIKALLVEKYGARKYKAEHATLSVESLFD